MGHSENLDTTDAVESVQAICDKHGEYAAKRTYLDFIGKWLTSACLQCSAERQAAEQAKDQKAESERDLARLRNAGVPLRFQHKTLDAYRVEHDKQQLALASCRKLVASIKAGTPAPNLIMIGKPGTGKSHLCCGIVLELYRTHSVRRVDLPDLIREIRATWNRDSEYSEETVLNWYGSVGLLIIEEVGTGAGTDDERARIFQVVNRRYESMLPTVVVSNLDMESLKREIGERVIDRLREGERSLVVFDWASQRGAA
jgi:DNA replication protein DnaC